MTDIVERLRMRDEEEAADEIARLRADSEHFKNSMMELALQVRHLETALTGKEVEIARRIREKVALAGLVAEERAKIERLTDENRWLAEENLRLLQIIDGYSRAR